MKFSGLVCWGAETAKGYERFSLHTSEADSPDVAECMALRAFSETEFQGRFYAPVLHVLEHSPDGFRYPVFSRSLPTGFRFTDTTKVHR